MNPVLQAALAFAEAGVSVVPASMDGSKAPIGSWKKYQVTPAKMAQVALMALEREGYEVREMGEK